jgi:hypothetical protein
LFHWHLERLLGIWPGHRHRRNLQAITALTIAGLAVRCPAGAVTMRDKE